jgi:cell division protein FtsB
VESPLIEEGFMARKWPAGFAFCLVLGWGVGAANLAALAQDQTPRQSDAAPPTAETPPAAPSAAPRVLTAPPPAQVTAPVPDASARFQFVRIGDTLLKLDGDTGVVSLCNARGADWNCQVLPENRAALDQKVDQEIAQAIGRLRQDVEKAGAASKGEIATLTSEMRTLKSGIETLNAELDARKSEIGALKAEVETLRAEAGTLKSDMEALTNETAAIKLAVFPPPPPPPPSAPESPSIELRMPTAEDYARARAVAADAISDAWRKLVAMIAQVQSDVMRKS